MGNPNKKESQGNKNPNQTHNPSPVSDAVAAGAQATLNDVDTVNQDGAVTQTAATKQRRSLAEKDAGAQAKAEAEARALDPMPETDGRRGEHIAMRNIKAGGKNYKAGQVIADRETIKFLEDNNSDLIRKL